MRTILAGLLCAVPLLAQAPLADLIRAGKLDEARAQIAAGSNVNAAQPDGSRAIHWAVYKVDHALVSALIAKKADVNTPNLFGSTPIGEAAKLGDTKLVQLLLDAGAKPDAANEDGETALMVAIKLGHLGVVQQLVAAGANVNAVERLQKQTPLMWAVTAPRNAAEMTRLLLTKGADPKPRALFSDWESQITSEPRAQYRPVGGHTALLYAARDGCYGCVDALLSASAGIDVPTPEGVTPLMIALDNEHNEVAKLLLDRGANPHVWDWLGRTALYIAVDRKAVLEVGAADVFNVVQKSRLQPPPAGIARVTHLQMINALLAAGVDPNPELNAHRPSRSGNSGRFIDPLLSTGCTPLLRAAMVDDVEVIRVLLAKGASPNINAMGVTPFLIAAGVGTGVRLNPHRDANMQALDLMVSAGADLNTKVTGTTTYSMRISRSASTAEGMTALHVAVQRGQVELVRYLLARGADPQVRDREGRRPVDLLDSLAKAGPRPAASPTEAGASGPVPRRDATPKEIEEMRAVFAAR